MNSWQIKILYDGLCPLCTREIAMLRRRDPHGRIAFEDIAAPGFTPGRYGLTQADVVAKMRGVLPSGEIITGPEVFRRAYSAIGLGWLVNWTGWPVLRHIADAGYWVFAKIRPRLHWLGKPVDCTSDRCSPLQK